MAFSNLVARMEEGWSRGDEPRRPRVLAASRFPRRWRRNRRRPWGGWTRWRRSPAGESSRPWRGWVQPLSRAHWRRKKKEMRGHRSFLVVDSVVTSVVTGVVIDVPGAARQRWKWCAGGRWTVTGLGVEGERRLASCFFEQLGLGHLVPYATYFFTAHPPFFISAPRCSSFLFFVHHHFNILTRILSLIMFASFPHLHSLYPCATPCLGHLSCHTCFTFYSTHPFFFFTSHPCFNFTLRVPPDIY